MISAVEMRLKQQSVVTEAVQKQLKAIEAMLEEVSEGKHGNIKSITYYEKFLPATVNVLKDKGYTVKCEDWNDPKENRSGTITVISW